MKILLILLTISSLLLITSALNNTQTIDGKEFILVNGTWVDKSCNKTIPDLQIEAGSGEYYDIIQNSTIASYASLGNVIFCTNQTVQIYTNNQQSEITGSAPSPAPSNQNTGKINTEIVSQPTGSTSGETKTHEPQPETIFGKIPTAAILIILVIAAFVVFSIMIRRPMAPDFELYKALSSDTRREIMNELLNGDRIPTDLSTKLGRSKSTIVEHLDKLIEAGLVEKIESPGKKFVFYKLTIKGRRSISTAG